MRDKTQEPDAVEPAVSEAYPAVLQREPNVRLSDGVGYFSHWRTGEREIALPSDEDEARQGWHCEQAAELLRTCPLVEPIGEIKA